MRYALAIVMVLGSVAWGQTTRPATPPDLSKFDANTLRTLATNLYRRLAELEAKVGQLQREHEHALEDMKSRRRDQLEVADQRIAALRTALIEKLPGDKTTLASLPDEKLIAIANPPKGKTPEQAAREAEVAKAIEDKRLILGMTLEEATRAIGNPTKLYSENEDHQIYQWDTFVEVTGSGGGGGNANLKASRFLTGVAEASNEARVTRHVKRTSYVVFRGGRVSEIQHP